jgi:hypothetical protein
MNSKAMDKTVRNKTWFFMELLFERLGFEDFDGDVFDFAFE